MEKPAGSQFLNRESESLGASAKLKRLQKIFFGVSCVIAASTAGSSVDKYRSLGTSRTLHVLPRD